MMFKNTRHKIMFAVVALAIGSASLTACMDDPEVDPQLAASLQANDSDALAEIARSVHRLDDGTLVCKLGVLEPHPGTAALAVGCTVIFDTRICCWDRGRGGMTECCNVTADPLCYPD